MITMQSLATSNSFAGRIRSIIRLPVILRRIEGHSMEPTMKEGSLVVAYTHKQPRRGDIVIAKIDRKIEVIKRVVDMRYGLIYLDGDNEGHTKKYSVMPGDIIAVVRN